MGRCGLPGVEMLAFCVKNEEYLPLEGANGGWDVSPPPYDRVLSHVSVHRFYTPRFGDEG